jgi:hypothetical protein
MLMTRCLVMYRDSIKLQISGMYILNFHYLCLVIKLFYTRFKSLLLSLSRYRIFCLETLWSATCHE